MGKWGFLLGSLGLLAYALGPLLANVRLEYLAREQTAGRIHVFRRTIPIRNVDTEVYK